MAIHTELIDQVAVFSIALVPVITGLIELIKTTSKNIDGRFIPLISLALGIVLGVAAFSFTDLTLTLRLWAGGIAGLAAVGLFEAVDNFKK